MMRIEPSATALKELTNATAALAPAQERERMLSGKFEQARDALERAQRVGTGAKEARNAARLARLADGKTVAMPEDERTALAEREADAHALAGALDSAKQAVADVRKRIEAARLAVLRELATQATGIANQALTEASAQAQRRLVLYREAFEVLAAVRQLAPGAALAAPEARALWLEVDVTPSHAGELFDALCGAGTGARAVHDTTSVNETIAGRESSPAQAGNLPPATAATPGGLS